MLNPNSHGNQLHEPTHALSQDPLYLLARVLKASDEGHIKGLYGPLHGAIKKLVEGEATLAAPPVDVTRPWLLTVRRNGSCTTWAFDSQSSLDAAVALANTAGFEIAYHTDNGGQGDFISDPEEFKGWLEEQAEPITGEEYRLLVIYGDVEPVLQQERFATYEEVVEEARAHREQDNQDLSDGLYLIRAPAGAEIHVDCFSGGELESD